MKTERSPRLYLEYALPERIDHHTNHDGNQNDASGTGPIPGTVRRFLTKRSVKMFVYIVSAFTLFMVFALFLVLSKTLNNIVNLLAKIEYLVGKETEYRKEAVEVQRLLENPPPGTEKKK